MSTSYRKPHRPYISAQEKSERFQTKSTGCHWSHLWYFIASNALMASLYLNGGAAPAPESARNFFFVGVGAAGLAWVTRKRAFID